MTAALRLALTLVASLLLWLPTVPTSLAHHDQPEVVGLRYLLALIVARVGVGLLFRIVRAYATPVLAELDKDEQPLEETADDEPDAPEYGRRRDDEADDEREQLTEALDDVEDSTSLVP